MRTGEFNDYLRSNKIAVFSVYDAAKIISMPFSYASKFLAGDKYVKRAARGLYYTRDANEYEAASKILFPSYISLVSALRLHNITEQMPRIIYVVATRQHKPIGNLNGYVVEFSRVKKELMYGYRRVDGIFVADPEKAIVDMLYLNMFVEYAEEVMGKDEYIDRAKLEKYAKQSGVKSIIRKIEAVLDADKG